MRTLTLTGISLLTLTYFPKAQEHSLDTTLLNNKHRCQIKARDINDSLTVLTAKYNSNSSLSDTIHHTGLLVDIQFLDFNKDGNSDILLIYVSNNETNFLYLFDSKTNRFKNVKDFEKYPEAVRLLSNSKYYYSYHRAGCADANWVSDLFKIINFKAIQVGHIYAQGCDFEKQRYPLVIKIYKVTNNNETKGRLISKLPYAKTLNDFEDKWDFINKFWNKNYAKFE